MSSHFSFFIFNKKIIPEHICSAYILPGLNAQTVRITTSTHSPNSEKYTHVMFQNI